MNKLPIYLYSNLFEVLLDLDQNRGIYNIMYQRKLRIQKGFKDSIQFQFKNSDQKPIHLTTATNYWFDMIDSLGRELVLTKPLTILDDTVVYAVSTDQPATGNTLQFGDLTGISIGQTVSGFGIPVNTIVVGASSGTVTLNNATTYPVTSATSVTFNTLALRGLATVVFNPDDTINLTAASYTCLVKQDNGDGTFSPAYSNTYYGITGEVEVLENGFPIGFPVQTVSQQQLERGQEYNRDPNNMGYIFFSGWLRPYPSAMTISTPQTASFSLDGFAGTITVQGTLDNNPSGAGTANAQAFTITSYTSTLPTTGNIQLSWSTNLTAVRFVVMPNADGFGTNYYPTGNPIGSNTNKFPNGFIDKIQYFS